MSRTGRRLAGAQAIFLVAYDVGEDGTPSPRYRDRLVRAAELSRSLGVPIFCLGGPLANRTRTNGEESRRYLVGLGVPSTTVRTHDEFPFLGESVETIQEAEAAAAVARHLGITRLAILSDLLQATQVRLVLAGRLDCVLALTPSVPSRPSPDDVYYFAVRCATLLLTLVDRKGRGLGWLRAWRSGRWSMGRRVHRTPDVTAR